MYMNEFLDKHTILRVSLAEMSLLEGFASILFETVLTCDFRFTFLNWSRGNSGRFSPLAKHVLRRLKNFKYIKISVRYFVYEIQKDKYFTLHKQACNYFSLTIAYCHPCPTENRYCQPFFLAFSRLYWRDFLILQINSHVVVYMFKRVRILLAYFVAEEAANLPFGLSTFFNNAFNNAFSCSSRSALSTKTDRALILLYFSQFCVFVWTVLRFVAAKGDNT